MVRGDAAEEDVTGERILSVSDEEVGLVVR